MTINNQKGQAIIWIVVGLAILLGGYMFVNGNSLRSSSNSPQNETFTSVSITPIAPSTQVTPTPTMTPESDEQIDSAIKKLNTDAVSLDKSLMDKPIDVNQ